MENRHWGYLGDNCRCDHCLEEKAQLTCSQCIEIRDKYKGFGPRHNGSSLCESGSIASGGTHAHCTCDFCW